MLPPGELGCDAGRRIRTGRAWRDQCVAASTRGASRYVFTCSSIWLAATRSLTDPLFSVPDGFRVILNGFTVDGVASVAQPPHNLQMSSVGRIVWAASRTSSPEIQPRQ